MTTQSKPTRLALGNRYGRIRCDVFGHTHGELLGCDPPTLKLECDVSSLPEWAALLEPDTGYQYQIVERDDKGAWHIVGAQVRDNLTLSKSTSSIPLDDLGEVIGFPECLIFGLPLPTSEEGYEVGYGQQPELDQLYDELS